ncbi:VOC family protein [Paenibacillus psychroresistens]|nr:VOC family protein [Paenibacillus psychroresistens]
MFERIESIYVPVIDLQASINWYQQHLGLKLLSQEKTTAQFSVYDGITKLTLIETMNFKPIRYINEQHKAPYFNFHILNLKLTYEELESAGVKLSSISENEYLHSFEIIDPNGNWLGVCYEKESSPYYKPESEQHPLLDRVGAVFIPVRDLQKSLDFYEKALGLTLYHHWGGGADLGVNSKDNLITLFQINDGGVETLAEVGRSYFSFYSADLDVTRSSLEQKGIASTAAVEQDSLAYCRLTDPDGHGLLVISGVKKVVVVN